MCGTVQNIVLLFVISFHSRFSFAIRNTYPSCRARDTCIRLTECLPYMNLIRSLRRPLSPAAVLFLRRQECGFDGTFPMVCCFPSDTIKAQVNRNNLANKEEYPKHSQTFYPVKTEQVEYANEGRFQLPSKPDFTPSDLSDYRSTKEKKTLFPVPQNNGFLSGVAVETTTTTAKSTTSTRLPRRVNQMWNLYDYRKPSTPQPRRQFPRKTSNSNREEELKNKMDAINHAFDHSSMDYFFVRRMLDNNDGNSF